MPSFFQTCRASGETFEITADDQAFYAANGAVVNGVLYPLPLPQLSPRERLRRRLALRNERNLYKTECKVSGRPLISVFSPDKPVKVVDCALWREQDNTRFGRSFDFSRPFFEQFAELYRQTYKPHVIHTGEAINSEYSHFAGWVKNCYLVFDIGYSEDCLYCVDIGRSRDCVDCFIALHSELCYEGVKLLNCYNVFFGTRCRNCSFSAFVEDCVGCTRCIGCTGLRNQDCCIFNQHVSKDEFDACWHGVFDGTRTSLNRFQAEFRQFAAGAGHRTEYIINCENSSGQDLENCVNVKQSINCFEARNLRYCLECYFDASDSYDVNNWGEQMDFCCELSGCGGQKGKAGLSHCMFGTYLFYGGYDLFYCINCVDVCEHLFGCADLVKKKYCILNHQYSPSEYFALLPKIIAHMERTGEWGEFFPMRLSPFGYNESLAAEHFDLDEDAAKRLGANWSDHETSSTAERTGGTPPDDLSLFTDGDAKSTFLCRSSRKPFRIVPAELAFYRKHRLPLPDEHFNRRHVNRRRRLYSNIANPFAGHRS